MATVTATRAASTFPAFKANGAGILCAAYGSYDFAAEPAAADILEICKVPAGAVILGGFIRAEDLDSDASETIDIDVGYAANGAVAADPDAFGNFGVQTGDAVTGYLPEGGVLLPLHGTLKDGPVTLTKETTITVTFVDDPATFAAGTVTVVVHYVVP
jgi:hypothetical protein